MDKYPTEFRGCTWDDHWEFDAPSVVYFPIKRYGIGGNSGEIDVLVEEYCIDLACGEKPRRGWSDGCLREFKSRGWSPRGFARRKAARHVVIKVRWYKNERGETAFDITKRTETNGPPMRRQRQPARRGR